MSRVRGGAGGQDASAHPVDGTRGPLPTGSTAESPRFSLWRHTVAWNLGSPSAPLLLPHAHPGAAPTQSSAHPDHQEQRPPGAAPTATRASVSIWVGEACSRARNLEMETSCSSPRWQFTHTLVGSTGLEVGFQLPFIPSGANMHTICSGQGSREANALQVGRGDRPGLILPSDPSKARPGASGTRRRSSEASARYSDSQRLVVTPRGAACPENRWPRTTRPSPQR